MIGSKYIRTCIRCKKEFDVKVMRNGKPSIRKTCSKQCHYAIRPHKKSDWTKFEIDYLEELAQSMPIMSIFRTYNHWARQNNFPSRTFSSIQHKVYRVTGSTKPYVNFFMFQDIATLLGVSARTVAFWKKLKTNPLNTYQRHKNGGHNYVSRKNFKKFALDHPEKLGGTNRRGLLMILEDEKLVDDILKAFPKRNTQRLPSARIRCVETNKIYKSLGEASRAYFVSRQTLTRAIQKGWRANGHHFERVIW